MIEVVRYTANKKDEWDAFVSQSEVFSFLFYRNYIEYHQERFQDYSLMLYDENQLIALLPCNIKNSHIISHQGLTYGGILYKTCTGLQRTEQYLNAIITFLKGKNITKLTIKLPPFFYSSTQDQTFHFVLNTNEDFQQTTDIGAHLYTAKHQFPKRCVRTGKLNAYQFEFSNDLHQFWDILEHNLNTYHNASAVHSIEEIEKLQRLFPHNIQLVQVIDKESECLHAGALVYVSRDVVKVQYFATADEGRKNRASDVLYYNLIGYFKDRVSYIDFGTNSNRDNTINRSLVSTKEKFGITVHPVFTYSAEL